MICIAYVSRYSKYNIEVVLCNLNVGNVNIFFTLFKKESAVNWISQGQLKIRGNVLYNIFYVSKVETVPESII